MLYVAIVLILTGILLLLYSVIVEPSSEKKNISRKSRRRFPVFMEKLKAEERPGREVTLREDSRTAGSETGAEGEIREVPQASLRAESDETDMEPLRIDAVKKHDIHASGITGDNADDFPDYPESVPQGERDTEKKQDMDHAGPGDGSVSEHENVVLYEDESGIIDYSSGTSVIDPTLEKYQQIKRIGSGRFSVAQQGINYHIEKKFFRFDFHRIQDLRFGDNYIALNIRGSSPVRLFLFQDGEGFIRDVDELFSKYRKDRN